MNALLVEFHSIFCRSHSLVATNAQFGPLGVESAAALSQQYRAAIRRAIKQLTRRGSSHHEDGQHQLDALISANLVWSLFEAVAFRPSEHSIVADLMEWGAECFTAATTAMRQMLDEVEALHQSGAKGEAGRPERLPPYWNTVIQQVLAGDFAAAISLLRSHSKFRSDRAFQKMASAIGELRDAFAQLREGGAPSGDRVDEFVEAQRRLAHLQHSGFFHQYDHLTFLCGLLTGQRAVFQQCVTTLEGSWFEFLPAFALYSAPGAEPAEVKQLAEELHRLVGGPNIAASAGKGPIDQTIMAILSMDCLRALQLVCQSGGEGSWWLATHLIDLLHHHDPSLLISGGESVTAGEDLRSRILLEYAQLLFNQANSGDQDLWELAPDYLMASGGSKRSCQLLTEYLSRMEWRANPARLERLLALCDKFDLAITRAELTHAACQKYIDAGEWSSALGWALRNGGGELIAHVARRIFIEVPVERISRMRIFDALSEAFLVAPELVLLYKFYSYKQQQSEGRLGEAVQLLYELFIDNSTPVEFHVVLFEETIRMLNANEQLREMQTEEGNGVELTIPTLDSSSLMDLMRAISIFQQHQAVRYAGEEGLSEYAKENRRRQSVAVSGRVDAEKPEVRERLDELLQLLRPLLAGELASASLS